MINRDEPITSAQNPLVKQLRSLQSSKGRREANLYVAEGIHLTNSYLASGNVPQRYVCAESALQNPEIAELAGKLDVAGVGRAVLADPLFESVGSIHASVGILILCTPHQASINTLPGTTSVLLEGIQDPGNLGTILRTAAAAGVSHAILSPGCASPWSPKALRAGMGAQFSLHVCEDADLTTLVQNSPVQTAVTTLSAQSTSLYDTDLTQPIAWILGNEGAGVSQPLIDLAKLHITIPQADTAVESLNVAAAAAVCLYEQYRQSTAQ